MYQVINSPVNTGEQVTDTIIKLFQLEIFFVLEYQIL